MKRSLFFLVLFFIFYSFCFIVMAEDEKIAVKEDKVHEDTPIFTTPADLEDRKVQLEVDFLIRSYKDGRSTYYATPLLLRMDTGPGTEFRISGDFLTYQDPRLGINDITLGFKWNFYKGNPNLAILPNVELPVGGAGFPAPEPLPGINLLGDINLNDKWCFSFNTGWSSQKDGIRLDRYNQGIYITQFSYSPDDNNQFAIGGVVVAPVVLNGPNVTRMYLNYGRTITSDFSLSTTLLKGLSSTDRDWQFMFGFNYCWHIEKSDNKSNK